ncbi:MAG: cysteine synthase A [Methanobacteriaceae archaeon]
MVKIAENVAGERIADNLTELIGKTPLVRLNKINDSDFNCEIIVKLESFNPLSSVKDRIALGMINKAEEEGLINKDTVLIEPTSGNTGIGLAFIAAIKGYKLILVMPETMSLERKKLLAVFGVDIVLTPGSKGMNGSIAKVEELLGNYDNSYTFNQFKNPANIETHYNTTANEIWEDCGGKIDIFIAGVGTGGTISGIAKNLKEKDETIEFIAVEPIESPVLSGGSPSPHKIQGIGAGFIPDNFKSEYIDEIITVKDEDASKTMIQLARTEGIFSGISSGASLYAALELAKNPKNKDKRILAILPDTGERYLSMDWVFEDIFKEYKSIF